MHIILPSWWMVEAEQQIPLYNAFGYQLSKYMMVNIKPISNTSPLWNQEGPKLSFRDTVYMEAVPNSVFTVLFLDKVI
jgi:hypothetical protein